MSPPLMAEVKKRWSVTYTKHVKQKRKVYQDGILHLLSNNQVMLYDETEQLLDSRFLTKDEIVSSGESLPFASFLVDIGDPEINPNIIFCPDLKSEYDNTIKAKSVLSHKEKLNTLHTRKLSAARRKTAAKISPSQKIIRDFKKSELLKYEVQKSQSPPSATTSSFTEWEALYTTQITQKAKKYHDGFLRMITCGSQGRQVMLFDSSRNQLDKRFLKRDEVICSGESLTFDSYLVDIGDRLGIKEDDTDIKINRGNCEMTEKMDTITSQKLHKSFVGKPQHNAYSSKFVNSRFCSLGVEKKKLGKALPSHMLLRDANQILSILRKPTAMDKTPVVGEATVEQHLSQSSVQLDCNHHDFQGSVPSDHHSSETMVKKYKDEKPGHEGYTKTSFEGKGTLSELEHDKLSAPPGSCKTSKERPVCTQGIQVVQSGASGYPSKSQPPVGSSLIDRLQASADHGISVILDSAEVANFKGSLSPVKSEAGTQHLQVQSGTSAEPEPKSEAADSTLDVYKEKCSTGEHRYIGVNVKIDKPKEDFDCPSFDLGFGFGS